MKARKIAYWITTALVALAIGSGGVFDALRVKDAMDIFTHLGYPEHFAVVLGIWKILGAITLLAPGLPRAKEWAYAGIFFDLTTAAVAHAAANDPVSAMINPIVILVLLIVSWKLRPDSRKLSGPVL